MQSAPENDGEAGDIGHPANLADDGGQNMWSWVLEGFEEVARCLKDDSKCRYNDGPEIYAREALEGRVANN